MKIAVLMTCHNRKKFTLNCLDSLFEQILSDHICLKVFLVDDGSTDGTSIAVSSKFPGVKIIYGNGDLFWCGGMRVAWSEASKNDDYDAYLWLNDDTVLYPDAINVLASASNKAKEFNEVDGIIVGSTKDPDTGNISYGGYQKQKDRPIIPSTQLQLCERMNGNIVLIPREVFKVLGNLSSKYTHAMGDMDYSFRAVQKGIPICVAPGFQGECESNPGSAWVNASTPLIQRLKILHSPKGLPPLEYMEYVRSHKGFWWPIYMLKLYFRVFFPSLWSTLKSIRAQNI